MYFKSFRLCKLFLESKQNYNKFVASDQAKKNLVESDGIMCAGSVGKPERKKLHKKSTVTKSQLRYHPETPQNNVNSNKKKALRKLNFHLFV